MTTHSVALAPTHSVALAPTHRGLIIVIALGLVVALSLVVARQVEGDVKSGRGAPCTYAHKRNKGKL